MSAVMTLVDAFDRVVEAWPRKTAVWANGRGDATELSYASLGTMVTARAETFMALGISAGDRILCHLPNSVAHVVAMNAAWRCGCIHVGVHPDLTSVEVAGLAAHTRASLVLSTVRQAPDTARAVEATSPNTLVLPVDSTGGLSGWLLPRGGRRSKPFVAPKPEPEHPAVIFFTSGTTGVPKGIVHTHAKLAGDWQGLAERLNLVPGDVHLGHLPLAHGFGLGMATLCLITGGELVLLKRFSAAEALELVERRGVTVFHGAPTHFRLMVDRLDGHDVSSLRTGVATAGLFPPPLIAQIRARLGMSVRLVYGCSEGINVGTSEPEVMARGAVGKPVPGTVVILGLEGQRQGPGEVGHIVFRAHEPVRYWTESDDGKGTDSGTAAGGMAAEGVYFSGDLGRLDEDGCLYVVGRAKEQINRGGQKVDPVEVDAALAACSAVADGAVVGLPDPLLGEVVCACVVPTPGTIVELEDLRRTLARGLARYKLPEALRLVEYVPRTSLGKVDRQSLRVLAGEGGRQS